MNKNSIRF